MKKDSTKPQFIEWEDYLKKRYPTKKSRQEHDRRVEMLAIGYEIYLARKKKKLSQEALAKKVGTTQSVIARIEAGNENISLSRLQNLARAVGKEVVVNLK